MDTDTNVANGYEYSCDLGDGFDHYSLPEITDCPLEQWLSSVTGQFDEDMITTHCGADVYTDSICVEDKKESETNSASDGVYQYKREESGIWTGPKYEKLDGTRFIYPYQYTASSNELVGWGIWDNAAQTGDAIWQCGFKKLALPETTPFISNIFDDCDTNDWDHWDGITRITSSQLKIVRCPTTKKVN